MRRQSLTLLLLAAAGCGPQPATPTAPHPGDRPRLSTIAFNSRDAALCAAHPFWRVKVTPEQIQGLVKKVREQQGDALVFADDHFTVVVSTDPAWNRTFRDGAKNGRRVRPDGLASDRWLFLDAQHGAAPAPDADVLASLKKALDAAEGRP